MSQKAQAYSEATGKANNMLESRVGGAEVDLEMWGTPFGRTEYGEDILY
jgi:hypothetical protein